MATLHYEFDEGKDYEYTTDLSDWIDNLDNEEAFDIVYTMFTSYPKYYSQLNITKDEVESLTKEDKDIIMDLLSLFSEADLLKENREEITDFYYDDANFAYKSGN